MLLPHCLLSCTCSSTWLGHWFRRDGAHLVGTWVKRVCLRHPSTWRRMDGKAGGNRLKAGYPCMNSDQGWKRTVQVLRDWLRVGLHLWEDGVWALVRSVGRRRRWSSYWGKGRNGWLLPCPSTSGLPSWTGALQGWRRPGEWAGAG